MNITQWKLTTENGTVLAQVLNFTPATDRVKLITKLYNGQYLAQTLGQPQKKPTATILVEDVELLDYINNAEATCEVLRLRYRDKIYTGYIYEAPTWNARIWGRAYTAAIEFAVLSEADAV